MAELNGSSEFNELEKITSLCLEAQLNESSSCDELQKETENGSGVIQPSKISDPLPWDDYFMSLCLLTSARSKDPNTKVGACIVNCEKKIVGLGYNGMPRGIKDGELPWDKTADEVFKTKYPYVCHAEMNAIMNCIGRNLSDCIIYVNKFPCPECAKLIIQSGIKKVMYMDPKLVLGAYDETYPSRKMFDCSGVTHHRFVPSVKKVTIDIQTPSKIPVFIEK
ncbi:Deoxycytidylate deaminase, partial [Stegodyphus mimosarum]